MINSEKIFRVLVLGPGKKIGSTEQDVLSSILPSRKILTQNHHRNPYGRRIDFKSSKIEMLRMTIADQKVRVMFLIPSNPDQIEWMRGNTDKKNCPDGVMIVYDVTNPRSFLKAQKWVKMVNLLRRDIIKMEQQKKVEVVLIGNENPSLVSLKSEFNFLKLSQNSNLIQFPIHEKDSRNKSTTSSPTSSSTLSPTSFSSPSLSQDLHTSSSTSPISSPPSTSPRNKEENEELEMIDFNTGKEFAEKESISFIQTCSIQNRNVKEAILILLVQILNNNK